MTGSPFVMRLATGLRRPKNRSSRNRYRGHGRGGRHGREALRPGDEVFGWCAGAFAEYAAAPEDQLIKKPANLTFEQAAAVGVSASTALQLLRDDGKVQPGQKVLINGASGGVGTFAVQIAKAFGAEVTGVTQHEERGPGPLDRCRPRHRLHARGLHRRAASATTSSSTTSATTRWPGPAARSTPTGTLISNGGGHAGGKLGRTMRAMLVSMVVRQQASPTVKTPEPRRPGRAQGPRRGRQGDPGDRHARTRCRDTPKPSVMSPTGHARGTVVITVAQGPSIAAQASLNTLKAAVATA